MFPLFVFCKQSNLQSGLQIVIADCFRGIVFGLWTLDFWECLDKKYKCFLEGGSKATRFQMTYSRIYNLTLRKVNI